MKKNLLITIFILFLISCKDRQENLNSVEIENSVAFKKHKNTVLGSLLESNQKQFSAIGDKSVIDSVNGFKSLHFGKSIDDLDVSSEENLSKRGHFLFINNENYSQVNVFIEDNVIRMAGVPAYNFTLEFYKKKLVRITVGFKDYIKKENNNPTKDRDYFDYRTYGLVSLCINSFGEPNVYAYGKTISLESALVNLDGNSSYKTSLQWQTDRIFYELEIEDYKKPYALTEFKERVDYYIIEPKIVTYLKSSKDSLDYFKEYYENQFYKNRSKTDSIKDVNQRKRAMSDL